MPLRVARRPGCCAPPQFTNEDINGREYLLQCCPSLSNSKGSSSDKTTSREQSPYFNAFMLDLRFPADVFGPVLRLALARLAVSCFTEQKPYLLIGVTYRHMGRFWVIQLLFSTPS